MAAKQPRQSRDTDCYTHSESLRLNNTAEGLSPHDTSPDPLHTYSFDPHESPALNWAGKSESTPFTVPTLAIHRHERVNPLRVLYAVRSASSRLEDRQLLLFPEESDEQRLLARLQ
ncbi:MAG: hypothetical protein IJU26_03465, partial [Synergistaceae bacterium]|nr:hypothetical protein [Synergistaceae bacterium]